MRARWPFLLALLGCHPPDEELVSTSSAVESAMPAPTATVSSSPPVLYSVENLLDLKRKDISRFGYAQATDMLFVSFSDPVKLENQPAPPSHENELEQWEVGAGKMVFRYQLPEGWIVDELFPSPDGSLLGARLYFTGDGSWCRLTVFDTAAHKVLVGRPCIEPLRWTSVRFTEAGDFVAWNQSTSYVAPQGAISGFDRSGQPRQVETKSLVREQPCDRCDVVENEVGRTDAGLYFTGRDGKRQLVAANHWHDNFALSNDGALLVTTTWDGEVIGWSTAESRKLFSIKWTGHYGYLAHDKKRDRFLLGDATSNTSYLKVLTRKP